MKIMYMASATATAGREGKARSDDGKLDVALAHPRELGGDGNGTNPEQLFAAGYAACFHSALLLTARQRRMNTDGSRAEAKVAIGQKEGEPGFHLAVEMTIHLPELPQDEADMITAAAHEICPYSNATRGRIPVKIIAVGKPGEGSF